MLDPEYAEKLIKRMVAQAMVPINTDARISDEEYTAIHKALQAAIAEVLRPHVASS